MVKRVCRSGVAVTLMLVLLFTTFASLFVFTNEDAQGANTLSYVVDQETTSRGLSFGIGGVWGFKYRATPTNHYDGQTNWMFCAQPSKDGWENGKQLYEGNAFTVYDKSDRSYTELMYKAVYYSIAGPGWNVRDSKGNYTWRNLIDNTIRKYNGTVPSSMHDSKNRYDDKNDLYYIVTHFVVSYIYAGKNFNDSAFRTMSSSWKNIIMDLTKAYDGAGSVKNKMTLFIANYNNKQSKGRQSMIIATFTRRLRIQKTSSDNEFIKGHGVSGKTGAIKSDNSVLGTYSFKGAKFAVFRDLNKAQKAAKGTSIDARKAGNVNILTTGDDGISTSDHVVGVGGNGLTYYAVEISAPNSNWAVSNTVYTFTKTTDYSHIDGIPIWKATVNGSIIKETPRGVSLRITKTSADTAMTDGNSNYSLAGTQFAIFTNKTAAAAAVKGKTKAARSNGATALRITTDSKGVGVLKDSKGNVMKLPLLPNSGKYAGTYYAVEIVAPKGYNLYNNVITFKKGSLSGNTYAMTASFEEEPKSDPIGVIAKKRNAITNSYDASKLAGAVFEVKYYDVDPTVVKTLSALEKTGKSYIRKWYFKTDTDGQFNYDSAYLVNDSTYKSSAMYFNSQDNPRIPLGAITIKEVAAPASGEYQINNTTYFSTVTGVESDVKVDLDVTIPENPSTTMISVQKKSDDDIVANIYFEITASDGSVDEIIKTDETGYGYLDKLNVYAADGKTKLEYTTEELGLMVSGSDSDRHNAKYEIPKRYEPVGAQTVRLTPNEPTQLTFVNRLVVGSISIKKTAEDNTTDYNTVDNVAFLITNSKDSTKTYNVTTDENGNALLDNVPVLDDDGNRIEYIVKELGVASTVQRDYVYGDIDCDGAIDNTDALLITKYASNFVSFDMIQKKLADVNGDGKITDADAACVRGYLVHYTDTATIGKTGTACAELGTGTFTEYTIPKRYKPQPNKTITLMASTTLTVTFDNTILKGKVNITKKSYDNVVNNIWFHIESDEGVSEYAATTSKGIATFSDLPVYDDDDEKIVYTITELGFKQSDGSYLFPAYYVTQEPKTVTLDQKINSQNKFVYIGDTEFYNRMYTVDLRVLKQFTPISESGVCARFRIKSITDGYSYNTVYTTQINPYDAGEVRNECVIVDLQPFLANGTSIVYEISELELVDSNGNHLSDAFVGLLDSTQVSWTKDQFEDKGNHIYKDDEVVTLQVDYNIDNYYKMGNLSVYKSSDDGIVSDIWFKVECDKDVVPTYYLKTNKEGYAELDKLIIGTVKEGKCTYTVTELGKMVSGSASSPASAKYKIPSQYETPKPQSFTFDDSSEERQFRSVSFRNKLYGSFRVHKVDSNGKPVAGAKISLIDSNGKTVGICTTDSTGYSNTLTKLPQGTYTVKETETPKGFYLVNGTESIYIGSTYFYEEFPWIGNDRPDGIAYVYGDVNRDGVVNTQDADEIRKYMGNRVTFDDDQRILADTNKDGVIGIVDITAIQKYVQMGSMAELNYTYDIIETEQPPFPPAGGMNLFGVVIASSLLLSALGALMIVRRKAGK